MFLKALVSSADAYPVSYTDHSNRLIGFPRHPFSLWGLVRLFIIGWAVRIWYRDFKIRSQSSNWTCAENCLLPGPRLVAHLRRPFSFNKGKMLCNGYLTKPRLRIKRPSFSQSLPLSLAVRRVVSSAQRRKPLAPLRSLPLQTPSDWALASEFDEHRD